MTIPATAPRLPFDRLQRRAWIVGGVGLALTWLPALIGPRTVLPCYLVAYLFWVGIALGCMALTMLHHLVGGTWGLPVRRPMEAGAMTLVPLAVLFLPMVLGMSWLYPWAGEEANDPKLRHKALFLSPSSFVIMAVIDFLIWIGFAYLLNRGSLQQDRTEDLGPTRRLQRLSGPGLAVVFLTTSFATISWIMSLEPHWYSTIYGAMVVVGWGLATFAAMLLIVSLLADDPAMAQVATPTRLQDIGNLMLAFVMLWAYMSFSQFLIIWSGNLVEEVPWYLRRARGFWEWVALALIVFHFFVPFFALLLRELKRNIVTLQWVAAAILVMRVMDLCWLVLPAFSAPSRPTFPWAAILFVPLALAGVGGIWVAVFLGFLKDRPLVPLHDPAVLAAAEIEHEHQPMPKTAGGA
jgi:hypothetical protein